MQWSTACPDWEQRITSGQSIIPASLPIDEGRAEKALRIFRRLRVTDIPGQPTLGDVCAPWIFELVRVVFGAHDSAARRQLIREFLILIGKKNSKSTIAAGIMVTALIMNERAMGEYLILAPTKDVADNSFLPAYGMIKADPALLKRYKPSDSVREIVNRLDGTTLAVKSADADVVGGQKAISTFIDELWLFGKKAAAANVLSEVTGSQAARPEGFTIFASTQSDEPPAGVFKTKLHYHRKVRNGEISDPTSLPLLYEYPRAMVESEAYRDRKTWRIPNPSLGYSVDQPWLETEFQKREMEGAQSLALFISKHFNVEPGIGRGTDGWTGTEFWPKRADASLTLESIIDRCDAVVVGLDGGGLDDLYGVCFLGRDRETRQWLAILRAWAHRVVFERRKSVASVLEGFVADGSLTVVGDDLDDVTQIVGLIKVVKDAGILAAVSADPAGIGEMVDALAEIDVTQENGLLKGAPQGYAMMNSIKTAERKLANGTMVHDGSPLGAWCVSNLKIEPTATAIRATKQNAGDKKIDPAIAMFNAVTVMALNPEPVGMPEMFAI